MAYCGGDQCKSRQDWKRKAEAERKWRIDKENQRRWYRAAACKTAATYGKPQSPRNWKTKVSASYKHYWLAKSSNSSSSGDLSLLLDIFVFSCQTSKLKLSTSSLTHHPRVAEACAALHPHVRTLIRLAMWGFWVNLHLVLHMHWTQCRHQL